MTIHHTKGCIPMSKHIIDMAYNPSGHEQIINILKVRQKGVYQEVGQFHPEIISLVKMNVSLCVSY